jgi:hypothetical protein
MFLGQKSSGSDVAAPFLIHRFIHVLAGKNGSTRSFDLGPNVIKLFTSVIYEFLE